MRREVEGKVLASQAAAVQRLPLRIDEGVANEVHERTGPIRPFSA
jgi:hypothetical protein